MAAVVVVGVQEACQGGRAFVVAGIGPQVGPLVQQGAVEAFDFAIGLRSVDAGELAGRAEVDECLLPGEALAVGPGVGGQDTFDAVDARRGEEGRGPGQKAAQVAAFSSGWISL